MWTISGLSCGRPFARKIFFTASPFSAFAARPYTVSVGMPTTSPARMSSAAVFTAFSSVSGVKRVVFISLHFHLWYQWSFSSTLVTMPFFQCRVERCLIKRRTVVRQTGNGLRSDAVSRQRDVYRTFTMLYSIIKEEVLRMAAKNKNIFITITGFQHYYGREPFQIGNLLPRAKAGAIHATAAMPSRVSAVHQQGQLHRQQSPDQSEGGTESASRIYETRAQAVLRPRAVHHLPRSSARVEFGDMSDLNAEVGEPDRTSGTTGTMRMTKSSSKGYISLCSFSFSAVSAAMRCV